MSSGRGRERSVRQTDRLLVSARAGSAVLGVKGNAGGAKGGGEKGRSKGRQDEKRKGDGGEEKRGKAQNRGGICCRRRWEVLNYSLFSPSVCLCLPLSIS